MEEDMMNNKDDDIEVTNPESSRRRNFQEMLPQSRIMENVRPEFRNLKSHPPGTKASVAQPRANGAKNASQKKDAGEKDYSFLFDDARFGGAGGAYNGGTNKQKKDDNKKQRKYRGDINPPDDRDPDDDDDNEETTLINGQILS